MVVILAILSGAELAGPADIFLAIPVVAVLSVVYRQWKEYGGGIGVAIGLMPPLVRSRPADDGGTIKNPRL